jgi:hypothetical protein
VQESFRELTRPQLVNFDIVPAHSSIQSGERSNGSRSYNYYFLGHGSVVARIKVEDSQYSSSKETVKEG